MMLTLLMVAALAGFAAGTGILSSSSARVIASDNSAAVISTADIAQEPVISDVAAIEPASTDSAAVLQTVSGRWGVDRVNAAEAIQVSGTLSTVLVAVIDTGIDESHASLQGKVIASIDFTGSGTTADENGHGTHMAGTIAAIAPNATFLNVKAADERGRCDTETVATAIRWAADNGAQVINISLEVAPSIDLQNAISHAWRMGAVIIAAAGNSGTTLAAYPAAYSETIAVAGTNQDNGLAVLSNHGDWVDIAAPGQKIQGEFPGGQMGYETGTSPAAAHVSGVAALLCSLAEDGSGDGLTNDEVRLTLETSAMPLGASGTGSGLVDALAAVQALAI
jgi:subtilisin family serine protease